jgi:hypothetical protein
MDAATKIVQETQKVLAGTPGFGAVTQTDMTRAIAARLDAVGATLLLRSLEQWLIRVLGGDLGVRGQERPAVN